MDATQVAQLIRQVADEIIRPRWRSLESSEIDEKRPGDYVTAADREAEEAFTKAFLADDPDAVVVGEEATFHDPGRMGALASARHGWSVDPVDGTRNFVHGSPDYAVMIAEVHDGETTSAWIYQPEHDRLFMAQRDLGVTCNGEPITPPTGHDPLLGAASRKPPVGLSGPGIDELRHTAWCCGVDYPKLLTGEWDFIAYSHSKPWDHLPGALMVRELGGVVRIPGQEDYDASAPTGRVLVAINERTWQAAAELIA